MNTVDMDWSVWTDAGWQLVAGWVVLGVVLGAVTGWLGAKIAGWPVWAGILLGILLPVIGPVVLFVAGIVRLFSTNAQDRSDSVLDRIVTALPLLAATVLVALGFALPWFRFRVAEGAAPEVVSAVPAAVRSTALGLDTPLVLSLIVLVAALACAAFGLRRWAGFLVMPVVGGWGALVLAGLVLRRPVAHTIEASSDLTFTVDDGLAAAGVDTDTPVVELPPELLEVFPWLEAFEGDSGEIDLGRVLSTVTMEWGAAWTLFLLVCLLLLVLAVLAAAVPVRARGALPSSSPSLPSPASHPGPGGPHEMPCGGVNPGPWPSTPPPPLGNPAPGPGYPTGPGASSFPPAGGSGVPGAPGGPGAGAPFPPVWNPAGSPGSGTSGTGSGIPTFGPGGSGSGWNPSGGRG
ncbi:hypothetical protein [Brevibacterium litoralis]|uniref:hypothetical protein n=1 Tax=Brevibacterium litoralis TaxID=3138935 RepID=UPI0032EC2E7C